MALPACMTVSNGAYAASVFEQPPALGDDNLNSQSGNATVSFLREVQGSMAAI